MAKGDEEVSEEGVAPKKGKKLIIIILFLVLVLLGAGGYFGAAFFLNLPPFEVQGPTPEEIAARLAAEEAERRAATRDIYVPFESAFTFNLKGNTRRLHQGQIEICLVAYGPNNAEVLRQHLVLLNSVFSSLLAEQSYEELIKPSGRIRLKELLLDLARAKMSEVARAPIVEQVLFTSYVVQ